jgi:hypothetical protein
MLKDKAGNRLFRKMTVKVIYPDKIFPDKTYVQHAGARSGFGPEGTDAFLLAIEEELTRLFPFWEFAVTELAPQNRTARFVFTFAGYSTRLSPSAVVADPQIANPALVVSPQDPRALEPAHEA